MDIKKLSINDLINTNPNLNNIDLQNMENINTIIKDFKEKYKTETHLREKIKIIIFDFTNNDIEYEYLEWLEELKFDIGIKIKL